MTTEVVLPSGVFARIRPVLVRDVSVANAVHPACFMAALISQVVLFDGKQLTVDEVLELEYADVMPIYEVLTRAMKKAMITKSGVA